MIQIRTVGSIPYSRDPHESRSTLQLQVPNRGRVDCSCQSRVPPFMGVPDSVRHEDRPDYTKHLLRLRHASQIMANRGGEDHASNCHDGNQAAIRSLAGHVSASSARTVWCAADLRRPLRVPSSGHVTRSRHRKAPTRSFDMVSSKCNTRGVAMCWHQLDERSVRGLRRSR